MTDEKPPLTLEQTLEAIKEEHEDLEDVKAVLAMSSVELDRKLEEQGFDLATVDARAEAREAEIRREQDRPARWGWLTRFKALITAFWMVLAAAATHAVDVWRMAEPTVTSTVTAFTHASAPELRAEAFEACGKMQWQSCLEKLDAAARTDPEGDTSPEVQRARAFAKKQLESQ
jgi:hypothetical protein